MEWTVLEHELNALAGRFGLTEVLGSLATILDTKAENRKSAFIRLNTDEHRIELLKELAGDLRAVERKAESYEV